MINSIDSSQGLISEQDLCTLWFPIIKKIASLKKVIRMKQGETVNQYTTRSKQDQYPGEDKIIGYKIDVRLLLDYEENGIDLYVGEVALNANDDCKLLHDRRKCLREAKEIIDQHI